MSGITLSGGVDVVPILIGAGVLLSGVILAFAVVVNSGASRRKFRQRIDTIKMRNAGAAPEAIAHIRRDMEGKKIKGIDFIVKHLLPRPAVLRDRLNRTGKKISPAQYVLACIVITLVSAAVFFVILGQPVYTSLPMTLTFGVGLPHMVINRMINRRINKFLDNFAEAIDLIVRGLKSGLPVTESITAVGREMADPVGTEFRQVSDSVRFGQSMEEALHDASRRIDTPDFKFFVISLSVQKETGGNLSDTLENLADILRRRRQMKLKIKAMSSEARASAYIIGSLPFILLVILYLMNPEYVELLWTDPRGNIMSGIGLGLQLIGVAVMAKMVKFEI